MLKLEGGVQANKWNNIQIEALDDKIELFSNGVLIANLPNTNRPLLNHVDVYAGDKYHPAANAVIKDLKFTPLIK